jgi:hypothetical protein
MYKKLGTNSIITVPMCGGIPATKEARTFVSNLKKNLRGTDRRVMLKGRKPVHGVKFDWAGNIPIAAAREADVYIYHK